MLIIYLYFYICFLESAVCSIFDKNDGLLSFLESELKLRVANKAMDDTLTEAFRFLIFFIENFYTTPCFKRYIDEIKVKLYYLLNGY